MTKLFMSNLRTEKEIIALWQSDPSQPLVSICCITFNHRSYIEDALAGFLIQETEFPFEVLIHDDASSDGTEEIIREYEKFYPNIIKPLYETENQWSKGRRGSITFNFPRAKGKYFAMCEGDDYWVDPKKLQKQIKYLDMNQECGLIHTDGDYHYTENGKVVKNAIRQTGRLPNEVSDPYEAILRSEYPVITCSTMFRTSLINKIDFNAMPRFKMADTLLWLELAHQSKVYFFNDTMVARHILIESAAHSKNYKKMMAFKESGYELCKYFLVKYGCTSETEAIVHEKFNRVILSYAFKVNNTETAKKAFQQLMKHKPQSVTLADKLHYWGSMHLLLRYAASLALFKLKIWKKICKKI